MKLDNLINAIMDINSLLRDLDDMEMDWYKWKTSKPTTIHAIADDKMAQIANMQKKISNALDTLKQLDI